jgi:hypothetical protein
MVPNGFLVACRREILTRWFVLFFVLGDCAHSVPLLETIHDQIQSGAIDPNSKELQVVDVPGYIMTGGTRSFYFYDPDISLVFNLADTEPSGEQSVAAAVVAPIVVVVVVLAAIGVGTSCSLTHHSHLLTVILKKTKNNNNK